MRVLDKYDLVLWNSAQPDIIVPIERLRDIEVQIIVSRLNTILENREGGEQMGYPFMRVYSVKTGSVVEDATPDHVAMAISHHDWNKFKILEVLNEGEGTTIYFRRSATKSDMHVIWELLTCQGFQCDEGAFS